MFISFLIIHRIAVLSNLYGNTVIMRSFPSLIHVVVSMSIVGCTHGYVTSYSALPLKRQHQWLRELTTDLCETQVGQLTSDKLSQGHQIMHAWSHGKTCKKEHAIAMENLVVRMVQERRAGNEDALVTLEDYNYLLEAWAKSGTGEAAAERCEAILDGMAQSNIQPNLSSYKAVLMAWRNCNNNDEAAVRAQTILENMAQEYNSGKNQQVLPDADCFDCVLQCYGRSSHQRASEAAEQLLFAMERIHHATGTCQPSAISFNAVLSAWAKSQKPEAAPRAVKILTFMERISSADKNSAVSPNAYSYSTVMEALAKHDNQQEAANRAQYVLSLAINRHKQRQEKHQGRKYGIHAILFSTAIGCLSKSNLSGSFVNAAAILAAQESIYEEDNRFSSSRPDVYSYTSVIDCCAKESNPALKKNAFGVARKTYEKMQQAKDVTPNHVSYGIMLKACAELLPNNDRCRRWTRRVFEDACRDGCVGDMAVARTRQAVSSAMFKDLMQGYSKRNLPDEWTRNIKSSRKPHRAEV